MSSLMPLRRRSQLDCCVVLLLLIVEPAIAESAEGSGRSEEGHFADVVMECLDAVLEHHADPPTMQEMLLAGAKALAGPSAPRGLGRQVSTLSSPDDIRQFLSEQELKSRTEEDTPWGRRRAQLVFIGGAFTVVPGGPTLQAATNFARAESVRENRYVGLGVSLGSASDKIATIAIVVAFGPADRAGVQVGDRLLEIDGQSTKDLSDAILMARLAGERGTTVRLLIEREGEVEPREIDVVRDVVRFHTIAGFHKFPDGINSRRVFKIPNAPEVGYVRITSIGPSTVLELRELERKLRLDQAQALIVDLRDVSDARLHEGVLLADAFLSTGTIGRVEDRTGERGYDADPDEIFAGWPVAVVVDRQTGGIAEWIAAAWQDQGRATIVGLSTAGDAWAISSIAVPQGNGVLTMRTASMKRGDGRRLLRPEPNELVYAIDVDPSGDSRYLVSRRPSAFLPDEPQGDTPAWGVRPDRRLTRIPAGFTRDGRRIESDRASIDRASSVQYLEDPIELAVDVLQRQLAERQSQ
jgi:carboxyl-terminal processing protease